MTSRVLNPYLISMLVLCLVAGLFPLKVGIAIILMVIISFFYQVAHDNLDYHFFLLVLIAAFWGPYLASTSAPSLFLFRLLLPIHLGLFLINRQRKMINSEFKYIALGLSIWILFSTLSLLWSDYPQTSVGSLYFEFEIVYFILFSIYYFDSVDKIRKAAIVLSINYFIIIMYSLIGEYFLEIHLRFSTAYISSYDTRPTGMFVNTNDFAAFISMYFSIFLLAFDRRKIGNRIIALVITPILLFISLLLIIQTNSRSGFIAFILILLLLFMKYMKLQNGIIIILLTILGALFRPDGLKFVDFRSMVARVELTFLGKMNSTAERMKIYKYALHSIVHNPFGMGVGSSQKHVFYLLNGYMNAPPAANQSMGMHNFLLAILFDTGLIGLLGFLIVLIYMGYQSIRLFFTTKQYIYCYPLLTLIGFIAASVGSSSIFEMRTVWIAFGLAIAVILNRKQISKEDKYA